jgi:hypothetical protein
MQRRTLSRQTKPPVVVGGQDGTLRNVQGAHCCS